MNRWFIAFILYTGLVSADLSKSERLIEHVKISIVHAEMGISRLPKEALDIPGMSSPKVRHLLNNLCSLPETSYLEIGCWKGSTLVAALAGNSMEAIAFDNWSELWQNGNSPREDFFLNVTPYLQNGSLRFFERDCFALGELSPFFQKPINVYFYDGNHSTSCQKKAFTVFNSILDDCFIAIVDDWNWEFVQQETRDAFHELGYQILFEQSFLTDFNGDDQTWWNGLYVVVIQKPLE